jgi:SnoaL-like domain
MLTPEFAEHFAADWIAAWNAHDLPRVLSHYDDDFEMASPRIVDIAGEPTGVLQGKARVGAYWATALGRNPDLHFELLGVFIGVRSIAIHYVNQVGRRAVETFEFAPSGVAVRSAAQYAPA